MKEWGLVCLIRMKKYHSYKGNVDKVAPHILKRNFQTEKTNKNKLQISQSLKYLEKIYICHQF